MTDWKLIRDGDALVLRDSVDGGGNYMRKMEKPATGLPAKAVTKWLG
jgi:hypothetical protein